MIGIAVLTHNRVELLRRCVQEVLGRTSELTREIVIWNNASTDGTRDYLDTVADPRVRAVHHPENLAMNALPRALALLSAPYLIELDDDVVEAPERWDETLLQAYRRLPDIGFLCASIAYDPGDAASRYLRYMREEIGAFSEREVDGVRILQGSVGGACTITSRKLYDRVGGVREHPKFAYWRPDIPYQRAIRKLGYESAFLTELEVRHEGGSDSLRPPQPKLDYHEHEWKWRGRKDTVKRVLLTLPFAAALNKRYGWFEPPSRRYDPKSYDPESSAKRPGLT